jgi:hypothetical protein
MTATGAPILEPLLHLEVVMEYRTHSIHLEASDLDIMETILELDQWKEKYKDGRLGITFSGFNDDRRPLNQIPEAKAFAQRLVFFGMLAPLSVTTMFPEISKEDPLIKFIGMGSLELYLLAKFSGDVALTNEIFDSYVIELKFSNRIVDELKKGWKS